MIHHEGLSVNFILVNWSSWFGWNFTGIAVIYYAMLITVLRKFQCVKYSAAQ